MTNQIRPARSRSVTAGEGDTLVIFSVNEFGIARLEMTTDSGHIRAYGDMGFADLLERFGVDPKTAQAAEAQVIQAIAEENDPARFLAGAIYAMASRMSYHADYPDYPYVQPTVSDRHGVKIVACWVVNRSGERCSALGQVFVPVVQIGESVT
jgi:hypothetical protein